MSIKQEFLIRGKNLQNEDVNPWAIIRKSANAKEALNGYLTANYNIRNRAKRMPPFVPAHHYKVFLLVNPVKIEVTPIIESPFTLKIVTNDDISRD